MSTTESTEQPPAHPEDEAHGMHPTEATYIKIAAILAVLTGIEVALYYAKPSVDLNVGALLVLAAAKFLLVAMYFMHLKFDDRVLRRIFAGGFFLAIGVYIAYLSTLHVFSG
jgi:cytochrome c oxidase subunit IV